MWDLISLISDRTRTPCTGRRSLNHWPAREVPSGHLLVQSMYHFLEDSAASSQDAISRLEPHLSLHVPSPSLVDQQLLDGTACGRNGGSQVMCPLPYLLCHKADPLVRGSYVGFHVSKPDTL